MKNFFLLISLSASLVLSAQSHHVSILKNDVERIETTLASNDMRGRRAGTPDADRAADFIAGEFKNAGLQPFSGNSFLQSFVMVRPKLKELKYKADEADVNMDNIVVVTSQEELKVDENSGYEVSHVAAGANLLQQARSISGSKNNTITFVDESHAQLFKRLTFLKRQIMQSPWSHIFILGAQPKEFKIKADHSFEETRFANVAAVIPGRSRKDEYVIFSAHFFCRKGYENERSFIVVFLLEGGARRLDGFSNGAAADGNDSDVEGIDALAESLIVEGEGALQKRAAGESNEADAVGAGETFEIERGEFGAREAIGRD